MAAKRILIALAMALFFAAPICAADGALPVKEKKIANKGPSFTLDFAYPHTGHQAIDREIEAWAQGLAKDFLDEVNGQEKPSVGPYTADLGYEIGRNDRVMFGVLFSYGTYMGGAHPNSVYDAFNFLMPEGLRVELAELFTRRGIERISAISIAALKKTLTGPDGMSDADWIKRGAGTNAKNFRNFILEPGALVLHFDAYQVAAYAAGPQEVRIPLARLTDVMRADPRAPAASFDCAEASTDVEHEICRSRELATLDRHLAEDYEEKMMWESDQTKRAKLRQEQRDWLKARDSYCRRAAMSMTACLSKAYQERSRALNPSP